MIFQWMQKFPSGLFPATCLLCGAPGENNRDLCSGCRAELPYNRHPCRYCALPLENDDSLVCGQCQQQPTFFERTFAPLLYQPPVDFLIKQLKFNGHLAVARLLGEWLGEWLETQNRPLPDCIIPVPLHPARLRERGFNQALELARPIAKHLGLSIQASAIRRIRHTLPQSLIDAKVRHSNVRGAFIVDQSLSARHVAVVDDVITTGSTVGEAARVLRTAGVTEIEIWACARTIPNR